MNRRTFVRRSLVAVPIALGAAADYAKFVDRHAVEVVDVEMELGMPRPLTVAVLSDIHFDPLCECEYLDKVIARTNELSPDLILYTGDFMSHSADRIDELVAGLSRASPGLGSFAILGNHDHWINADRVCVALASAGISVLRNQSVPIPDREPWYLTGLESFWAGAPNTRSLESTPSRSRHLVLAHELDSFDLLTDARIGLQLSGHTHGGQIRVPWYGAIQLPTWGKKYQAGLYERGGRRLYVNRGIGTVGRHFRMNCPPEITCLRIS